MYELEIYTFAPPSLTPPEVPPELESWRKSIRYLTLLPWEEHCVECAMPACFESCSLYVPRNDGKCRRFTRGIELVRVQTSAPVFRVVSVDFKKWGRLFAYGNLSFRKVWEANAVLRFVGFLEYLTRNDVLSRLSLFGRKNLIARFTRRIKQRLRGVMPRLGLCPTGFVAEVYTPELEPSPILLTIQQPAGSNALPFQKRLTLRSGWNVMRIDGAEFEVLLKDGNSDFMISIDPLLDEVTANTTRTLAFGYAGFVVEAAKKRQSTDSVVAAKAVKVVIWDLDNTLWDGVLTEDGEASVSLNQQSIEFIKELDQRGIVQSVSSKNDGERAESFLRKLGIWEYFVFPQINWDSKGRNVQQIIRDFNVHPDTVVFIDDSEFERSEVASVNPDVRVYHPREVSRLTSLEVFRGSTTKEASQRRAFYQAESKRKVESQNFEDDYHGFLQSIRMAIRVERLSVDNLERAHELVTRTNQLNFSGNRYSLADLTAMLQVPHREGFLINSQDKFGDYGVVGFALIDTSSRPSVVTDFALSCRVQSKRVEHEFLRYLHQRCADKTGMLHVVYRQTERNTPAGRVFSDIAAAIVSETEGSCFVYALSRECFDSSFLRTAEIWDVTN